MISEDKARAKILESIRPLPSRQVALTKALDCFAAENPVAQIPLPTFDNSAMDGYAVVASATRKGQRLRIIGEQPAGEARNLRIRPGEAVRIFTGAPIPNGADAIIMQEDVRREGEEIVANEDVDPGQFIRRRGCDLSAGQKTLQKGERIRATTLALLASQGRNDVEVGGEVRASIISTGDELVAPGQPLRTGEIYDSNSTLLIALLEKSGAKVVSLHHCNDESSEIEAAIADGSQQHVMVITGGVSVGEHDLVQEALRKGGAKIDIWRVAIKPGKPFLFGRLGDCCVFGLPGNPVSAFVTFLKFVRPPILRMMGANDLDLPKTRAKLVVDLNNDSERAHYIRGKLEGETFAPVGRQESHALFGLSQANGLLRLAAGAKAEKGAAVDVEIWD